MWTIVPAATEVLNHDPRRLIETGIAFFSSSATTTFSTDRPPLALVKVLSKTFVTMNRWRRRGGRGVSVNLNWAVPGLIGFLGLADLRGERLRGDVYIRMSYLLYTCCLWEFERLALYACVAFISTCTRAASSRSPQPNSSSSSSIGIG